MAKKEPTAQRRGGASSQSLISSGCLGTWVGISTTPGNKPLLGRDRGSRWETDLGTLSLILLLPIKRRWLNLSVFCLITFRGSLDFEEVNFQTQTTCRPQRTEAPPRLRHSERRVSSSRNCPGRGPRREGAGCEAAEQRDQRRDLNHGCLSQTSPRAGRCARYTARINSQSLTGGRHHHQPQRASQGTEMFSNLF